MVLEAHELPDEIEELNGIIVSQNRVYQSRINALEERVRYLHTKLFGRGSEKYVLRDDTQVKLFDEAEDIMEKEDSPEDEQIFVPSHSRKKPCRKPLPKDLPRVDVIHDLREEERICGCGTLIVSLCLGAFQEFAHRAF